MKGEDLKQVAANGSGDSSSTEGIVDSTTDVAPKQEPSSDNPESDSVAEGAAGIGPTGSKGKTGKNIKKNALKGKKKSNQKTDSPAKCEDLKASDTNGPVAENNGATTGINKTKVTTLTYFMWVQD